MSNPTLSVPKTSRNVRKTAPLTQPWPDGWSGNGGVASGGVVAVEAWNSGSQVGSATVSGLPSVAASWIAARGRQKLQWYLSFQHADRPVGGGEVHHREEAGLVGVCRAHGRRRDRAPGGCRARSAANCQKIAAVVWSAVRVVLFSDPIDFTSSKSFVYSVLVSAFGPFERNCDGLSITNGFRFPTQASGSIAVGRERPPLGRHRADRRSNVNGAKYPSFARAASIAAAAAAPDTDAFSPRRPAGIRSSVFCVRGVEPGHPGRVDDRHEHVVRGGRDRRILRAEGCASQLSSSSRYGLYAGRSRSPRRRPRPAPSRCRVSGRARSAGSRSPGSGR